eukprot:COSAG01_NODE_6955_length_3419_cov_95.063855_4_plen_148_part_00
MAKWQRATTCCPGVYAKKLKDDQRRGHEALDDDLNKDFEVLIEDEDANDVVDTGVFTSSTRKSSPRRLIDIGEFTSSTRNSSPGRQLLDEDIGVITSSTRNSCPGRQLEDIGVFTSSTRNSSPGRQLLDAAEPHQMFQRCGGQNPQG